MTRCPTEDDLLRFLDGALSIEDTEGVRAHLATCPRCRQDDAAVRTLVGDVEAPVRRGLDVRAHVDAVMARLDRPAPTPSRTSRWVLFAGATSVAAGALAMAVHFGGRSGSDGWQARGGGVAAGLDRDVGVQPYAVKGGLELRKGGGALDVDLPLTAGFRNVGRAPVFLLLFAVDSRKSVHWISPEYVRLGDDPVATPLPVTTTERVLETSAVLEDVPPGRLRIVAVVTPSPAHVSDIESLPGDELTSDGIVRRLHGASVRETVVQAGVADASAP
jgi:Putative zinc-finger